MAEYKLGDVVAQRVEVDQIDANGAIWCSGDNTAIPAQLDEIAPWPDAERMALLEAVAEAARAIRKSLRTGRWFAELDALAAALERLDR